MAQASSKSNGVQMAGQSQPARAQTRLICRLMAMLWMWVQFQFAVTPVHHVVGRPLILNALFPRHARTSPLWAEM